MFLVIKRKYLRAGVAAFIFFVLFICLRQYYLTRASDDFDHIDSLSATLKMAGSEVEKSRKFNSLANKLMKRKLREDVDNVYYSLETKITKDVTSLKIPDYFKQTPKSRIKKGPFDPRFTLAAYFEYLTQNKRPLSQIELPFHWSDWVDVSPLDPLFFNKHEYPVMNCSIFDNREYQAKKFPENDKSPDWHKGALDPNKFCRTTSQNTSVFGLELVINGSFGRMTEQQAILAARTYLYSLAPNPLSILFLTKDGSYHLPIAREKTPIISGGPISRAVENRLRKLLFLNTLEVFRQLQKERAPAKKFVTTDYEIPLKHEDFVIDPTQILLDLHTKENERDLSKHELMYRDALLTSMALKDNPPKYFLEAQVFDTVICDHYDWRFFNGLHYQSEENSLSLHRLVRTWLSFTRKLGFKTWAAHGTLLAWHFNGMNFPWDDDVDVQMPIQDFLKLSAMFNQSLIVEDVEDGFGRFFLDCATYVTTRTHGNGNNNIDARFIDIDSGLYIDITALAVSDEKPSDRFKDLIPKSIQNVVTKYKDINYSMKFYNCRNFHFVSLAEVSPLVRTFFDGELAYVPKNHVKLLKQEYGDGIIRRQHAGRVYLGQLRIWVDQEILMVFLRHPDKWDTFYSHHQKTAASAYLPRAQGDLTSTEFDKLQNLSENDLFRLLHHDDIFIRYQKTRDLTMFHEAETTRFLLGKSTEALVLQAPDLPPLKFDPFLHTMHQQYLTFEDNVIRYQKLALYSDKAKRLGLGVKSLERVISPDTLNHGSDSLFPATLDVKIVKVEEIRKPEVKEPEKKESENKDSVKEGPEKKEFENKEAEKKELEKQEFDNKEPDKKESEKKESENKDSENQEPETKESSAQ